MIYLDSSVALAHVLSEGRRPSLEFWRQPVTASRLLQFEVWNRLHAYDASSYRHGRAREILRRVSYVEMRGDVLVRALRPFERPVRTLDAMHLATMDYLRNQGAVTTLASYDRRLLQAAQGLGFEAFEP